VTRVLVIGGGMAGGIAALAARERGADVTLVRRSYGATALSSGAIDVAADPLSTPEDPLGSEIPMLAAADEIGRLRPGHPYGVLRERLDALPDSLQFAQRALAGLIGEAGSHNRFLSTPFGTAKPTAMAQLGMDAIDMSTIDGTVGVVHFPSLPHFNGDLVAAGLKLARERLRRSGQTLPIPCDYFRHRDDALLLPHELAARTEADVDGLANAVKRSAPVGISAFLFPPFLARRSPAKIAAALEKALGAPCGETVSGTPSVPGLRLQEAIDDALRRAGVRIVLGEVRAGSPEGPFQAFVDGGDSALETDTVVLATGKYIGGGVTRAKAYVEPVFRLPIHSGRRRLDSEFIGSLLDRQPGGDHEAFRAGVRIDDQLRPMGEGDQPVSRKLFAAGGVVAGYDPAFDKTGLGVAIFTGYLSGRAAAG
jgi:glycerol-3-phosphate dehydrogenase subunit B